MAVANCASCGRQVSAQLIACPDCGTPVGYSGGTSIKREPTSEAQKQGQIVATTHITDTSKHEEGQAPPLARNYQGMREIIEGIETYNPSGKLNPVSIPIMLVIGGGLGIAAAFIVHLIWQFTGFYLMVLFPAGIGVAAGLGLGMGIGLGKCRNVAISIFAGLIIGALSYISMHYFDMLSAGAPDLITYLNFMAKEGYTIFFIPISGPFAWLTWIIEIGVVIAATVVMAMGSASGAFCEKCNDWINGELSFSTASSSADGMISALYNKQYDRLKELKDTAFGKRSKIDLKLAYCESCKQTGYMTVTRVTPGDKDDETNEDDVVTMATVTPQGIDTLLRDFQTAS